MTQTPRCEVHCSFPAPAEDREPGRQGSWSRQKNVTKCEPPGYFSPSRTRTPMKEILAHGDHSANGADKRTRPQWQSRNIRGLTVIDRDATRQRDARRR